jgi:acyl dehydratase
VHIAGRVQEAPALVAAANLPGLPSLHHRPMSTDHPSKPVALGERSFSAADQRAFARASGDVNPMHMDPVAARRLLSGRQVVHGVHTLLQALDWWQPRAGFVPRSVACSFDQPISVGDVVCFEQVECEDGRSVVSASVDGLVCTVVTIGTEPMATSNVWAAELPRRDVGALDSPLDEAPGSQAGQVLTLATDGAHAAALYPRAAQRFGAPVLGALAGLSYCVGMVCPGQHSVFSSLQFAVGSGGGSGLELLLKRYDARFKLFQMAYRGAVEGELRAFLRPPPQPQPGTRALMAHVQGDEFAGRRCLVLGGSRGLGEMTAKLLGAGGAQVVVSYAAGLDDAQRVADDINATGAGSCEAVHIDLAAGTLALPAGGLDAVFFFATPRIFRKKAGLFDAGQFAEFARFYLERFEQLCMALEARAGERPVTVYLPSTVFITDRPKGMTEYAMTKAAAEVLADDLNRVLRHVRIVHTRLPRLATDQTSSILGVSVESNIGTLLPVVRQVLAPRAA